MNLKASVLATGGIGALLGLGNLWPLVVQWLGLPENFLTLPTPVKILLLVSAVAGLIATSIKTSKANPDGTPATEQWKQ